MLLFPYKLRFLTLRKSKWHVVVPFSSVHNFVMSYSSSYLCPRPVTISFSSEIQQEQKRRRRSHWGSSYFNHSSNVSFTSSSRHVNRDAPIAMIQSPELIMDLSTLYQYLELYQFTPEELNQVFSKIKNASGEHDEEQSGSKIRTVNQVESEIEFHKEKDFITFHDISNFLLGKIQSMHPMKEFNSQTKVQEDCCHGTLHQQKCFAQVEAMRFIHIFQPFCTVHQSDILKNCASSRSHTNSQVCLHAHHTGDETKRRLEHRQSQHFIMSQNDDTEKKEKNHATNLNDIPSHYDMIRLHRHDFISHIRHLATKIDVSRTFPISLSMFLVGSSVGIIIPIMPFVVSDLGLSSSQYGIVVGSFAVAKLLGNVPSAIWVEQYGRKPFLIYSLLVVGIGVGGIGISSHFEHLILCRLLTGFGVAALSTAATLFMADISTPLNRATTMAPIMSSFAAGTAIGPALGGIFADSMGIDWTFYFVGCSFFGFALVNRSLLVETKPTKIKDRYPTWLSSWDQNSTMYVNLKDGRARNDQGHRDFLKTSSSASDFVPNTQCPNSVPSQIDEKKKIDDGIGEAIRKALSQWLPLLSDEKVRNVVIMNGIYWVALAGAQMTLLPLILTDSSYGFALSASNVGKVYMGMSLVQVLGNPVMARFVDRLGKSPAIIVGCSFLSSAMFLLPQCADMPQLAGTLGLWALGSTMLSTAPVSYISDVVADNRRAQAVALLRTAGDIGLLVGASISGTVADWYDFDTAVQTSAGLLLTTTAWFATRHYVCK